MMSPVQIVIGRGRGSTVRGPLGAAAWGRFRSQILHALSTQGEFYAIHPGMGVDMNGYPEENATILGSWPDGSELILEQLLERLREEFEQAVILLIWGELQVIA